MFEIILHEDYEDHYLFRDYEKAEIEAKNRDEFLFSMNKFQKKPV
jgi:hypothetical protein